MDLGSVRKQCYVQKGICTYVVGPIVMRKSAYYYKLILPYDFCKLRGILLFSVLMKCGSREHCQSEKRL